ncbi:hypothetical protein ABZ464_04785 [Streptomyces sp. NPDC005820]|uniref:hypothetical protein n=1 Tax=Streptomyces sp. NPDC005820 TaxID=3157069 RepID=UPI0033EDE11B
MLKLRKAGLVAAMIGSLTLAGAGVASATEAGTGGDGDFNQCIQQGDVNVGLINLSDLNLALGLLGGGSVKDPSNTQQSCSTGDNSPNTSVAANVDGSTFGQGG